MADDKKENGKGKKPRKPTALKRDEQSLKRNLRNRSFKSKVTTAVRVFEDSVTKKDATGAKAKLSDVYSLMDKGVKKGIYKMNKANRVKSRLNAKAKQISA
ncbi:MAG: 30S ribosomal protein S20 [Verrucomicrobia bacterium]|nr:30S ribosomal protein S20 [Verrucomicrobiota bacterium]